MQQAAVGDCLSFDPFPFDQNGLAPPEVDVGGRQVGDALVISQVIVAGDEGLEAASIRHYVPSSAARRLRCNPR
jgi:hypothetical protein